MDINTQNVAHGGYTPEAPRGGQPDVSRVEAVDVGSRARGRQEKEPPQAPAQKAAATNSAKVEPEKREADIKNLVKDLNLDLENLSHTSVRFRVDHNHKALLISVVDTNTDKIVRQIPSEEMVELNARMKELQGLLFDRKA